mmetsp:Transcript_18693/g.47264  ORF Transcript_18693/g.47264 Transcript_18693/m.47264 type:complete len:113 (-) Transcript_18693:325-663(-)
MSLPSLKYGVPSWRTARAQPSNRVEVLRLLGTRNLDLPDSSEYINEKVTVLKGSGQRSIFRAQNLKVKEGTCSFDDPNVTPSLNLLVLLSSSSPHSPSIFQEYRFFPSCNCI